MKVYRGNIIFTPEIRNFEVLEHGCVAVDEQGIVQGCYAELPELSEHAEVVDFGERLLIPAFNDLHVHAPQYRNMGLAMDLQLLDWLNTYTFPEEQKYAQLDYAERHYRRFVHELWMQGTMRSAIFATIHPEATHLLARLLKEAGLGAYVGLVGMDRNCPAELSNSVEEVVRDTLGLMTSLSGDSSQSSQPNLVRPIVTPRFVPSCTDSMLHALGELAQKYRLPVQSHLSENLSEIQWVKELEPLSRNYGDAYYQHGLFGQTPTLMAHCCYTKGAELNLMKRQGVIAVHCPTSNCNIASGMAHVRTLLDEGIQVALGSDISGGHNMSMLRVMQYALQVSKLVYAESRGRIPFLTLSEVFYMATKSGGSFFGRVGSFEPGYEFDALVVDDSYLNYDNYTLPERLERYVYLGDDRDITHRFCRGRLLV